MPYSKQTWQDNNSSFPLSAARMTNIEDGIEAAAIVADQGHLVLTTAQRDALGVVTTGTMIYNSTTQRMEMYDGSDWNSQVVTTDQTQTLTNKTLTGPTISSPAISGGTMSNTTVTNSGMLNFQFITPQATELNRGSGDFTTSVTLGSNVSTSAHHVLANVFLSVSSADHVNFTFMATNHTRYQDWVNSRGQQPSAIFGSNHLREAVILTHHGDSDGWSPFYGVWFSSQILPVTGRTLWISQGGNSGSSCWVYVLVRAFAA